MTATLALHNLLEGRLREPASRSPLVYLSSRDGVRLGSAVYRFEMTFEITGTGPAEMIVDSSGLSLHEFSTCWVCPGDRFQLTVEVHP